MADQLSRSPRTVTVADHLWDTFGLMSEEMGVDRDGLVNQALFAFARQHGYVQPGARRTTEGEAPTASVRPAPVSVSLPPPVAAPVIAAPAPVVAVPAPVIAAPIPIAAPVAVSAPPPMAAARMPADDVTPASGSPAPAAPFANGHVHEESPPPQATAAIRAPRASAAPTPVQPFAPAPPPYAPPPAPAYQPPPSSAPDLGTKMSPDEVRAAQERVLQKAAELERLVRGGGSSPSDDVDDDLLGAGEEPEADEDEGTPPPVGTSEPMLVLYAEGREVDRVTSARFLIGRGKHCDLIINSGKVSREHAAIVREGEFFYIEDLGSSNGTWFDKKRITRRRVEDGDEYFVCSEKLTCRVS